MSSGLGIVGCGLNSLAGETFSSEEASTNKYRPPLENRLVDKNL